MDNIEEFKELLNERECQESTFFTNPSYITAVLGISDDNKVIYSYDKMVEYLMNNDGMSYEDAVEFIEYNTIRTIPYMGEKAPIICYKL